LRGKGGKERRVPIWKSTARLLSRWVSDNPGPADRPLFPNRDGQRMTRSGVAFRLRLAVDKASATCPSDQRQLLLPVNDN